MGVVKLQNRTHLGLAGDGGVACEMLDRGACIG